MIAHNATGEPKTLLIRVASCIKISTTDVVAELNWGCRETEVPRLERDILRRAKAFYLEGKLMSV